MRRKTPVKQETAWQEISDPELAFAEYNPRRWSEHNPEPFRREAPKLPPRPRPSSQQYPHWEEGGVSESAEGLDSHPPWAFPEPHVATELRRPDPNALQHDSDASSPFWDANENSDDNSRSSDISSFEAMTIPHAHDFAFHDLSHLSYVEHTADVARNSSPTEFLRVLRDRIQSFQEGELEPAEQEWHKLTPEGTIKSLSKKEVQRQSTIFEVVKSERDYTLDLQLVNSVFIVPLRTAEPPVIAPPEDLENFIHEVFYNINEIVVIHENMVRALFDRQVHQHPIIDSVSDIVLDAALSFQPEYERYMKHYPLAENRHRQELKNNKFYQEFLENCSQDTRISKRDLITFLSRPVTRLPRLNLMIEHILKLTEPGHGDVEELKLILSVLSQFIKSTQPGIAAAEGKAKLMSLAESLVFDKGEIIDLDMHNEYRTLVYQGNLARSQSGSWGSDSSGWNDLMVALLDHYLLMTKPYVRAGVTQYVVVSRPIPLEFLRVGGFNAPAEQRKDESEEVERERGLLSRLRGKETVPVYPFMVWHGATRTLRRYTLFASSDAVRKRWHGALEEAIFLRKAQQEANRYFATEPISGNFFRSKTIMVPPDAARRYGPDYFTGKMTCAARFVREGRTLVVVGCGLGIYVGYQSNFNTMHKAVSLSNPTSMAIFEAADRLLVLYDGSLLSYPVTSLVRVAQSGAPLQKTAMQRLDTKDGTVLFFRVGSLDGTPVVVYAVRTFRHVSFQILEVKHGGQSSGTTEKSGSTLTKTPTRGSTMSLTHYGSPVYVPRDATEVTLLKKTLAIAVDHALVIVDPVKNTSDRALTVPDFAETALTDVAANDLKRRCQKNVPLGIMRSGEGELLVVYDTFGCWITKHGAPARKSKYVRWETRATAWMGRQPYILLFSADFIEVRFAPTGRLVQVIENQDIRLVQNACADSGPFLIATKGDTDDQKGLTDKLMEVVETRPLVGGADDVFLHSQFSEWD